MELNLEERLKSLSTADADLVRDCELEAQDAKNLGKYLDALVREGILEKLDTSGGYKLLPGRSHAECDNEPETLCSLGRGGNYTPFDNVEGNILYCLASSAFDLDVGIDDARAVYQRRVKEIFGSVTQCAVDFFEQELVDYQS